MKIFTQTSFVTANERLLGKVITPTLVLSSTEQKQVYKKGVPPSSPLLLIIVTISHTILGFVDQEREREEGGGRREIPKLSYILHLLACEISTIRACRTTFTG